MTLSRCRPPSRVPKCPDLPLPMEQTDAGRADLRGGCVASMAQSTNVIDGAASGGERVSSATSDAAECLAEGFEAPECSPEGSARRTNRLRCFAEQVQPASKAKADPIAKSDSSGVKATPARGVVTDCSGKETVRVPNSWDHLQR